MSPCSVSLFGTFSRFSASCHAVVMMVVSVSGLRSAEHGPELLAGSRKIVWFRFLYPAHRAFPLGLPSHSCCCWHRIGFALVPCPFSEAFSYWEGIVDFQCISLFPG